MYDYRLLTIRLFTILPRPQPFASRKPTCAGSPRILLFYYYSTTTPAVCISETDLRRSTQDFTILLFYYSFTTTPAVCISETDLRRFAQDFTILLVQYCTILLCTILLLTIPLYLLFYHDPSLLHLGNRPAPVHQGFYYLHFFYFTILLFYYYSTTTPAVCISETDLRRFTQDFTILLFYYFTISVLYYSTMYYFTVNYSTIYYSTTTPAVCISETDLRRFTQDFTILLV